MDWVAWRGRMSALATQFCAGFEPHFGYPPDEHEVTGPTDPDELRGLVENGTVEVPDDLVEFYRHVGEVSLPDLNNGYFIHPAARVAEGVDATIPGSDAVEVVHDAFRAPVIQIGSDGGGGLYVLERQPTGRVLYLPAGELRDGIYTGNPVDPPRLAAAGLEQLLLDWEGRLRDVVVEMTPA